MNFFKKIITPLFCCFILGSLLWNIDIISTKITRLLAKNPTYQTSSTSEYKQTDSFIFVQNTDKFTPLSQKDIKNIFYTIVNNGWNNFTFYCPNEYQECIEDIKDFSQNQDLLTHINNFVHPYNSFTNIKTTLSETGEVNVNIEYLYDRNQLQTINEKIDEIMKQNLTSEMDLQEKIKVLHDYIINNTKYDVTRNENGESKYQSYIAYGPLFEGFATCNGYTDAMALFLTKLGIKNYKIATTPTSEAKDTEGHVWNAVYLENKWLHLDLTWDDPVSTDNKDYLQHKYFLVNNEALKKADEGEVEVLEHNFKKNIYLEFKTE